MTKSIKSHANIKIALAESAIVSMLGILAHVSYFARNA